MEINRLSYKILENSISLYLSFNDSKEEDIIIRILGDIKGNPNNLEEYLTNTPKEKFNYYKTFILIKPTIEDPYLEIEEISNKMNEKADLAFNKVLNDFILKSPIIDSHTLFVKEDYQDEITYTGTIISKEEDLIAYIVNTLLEKQLDILQEDYGNYEDENQLCLKL